jgi:hypothetical protein
VLLLLICYPSVALIVQRGCPHRTFPDHFLLSESSESGESTDHRQSSQYHFRQVWPFVKRLRYKARRHAGIFRITSPNKQDRAALIIFV